MESKEGRVGAADSLGELALARNPSDPNALAYLARTKHELGRIKDEVAALESLRRLNVRDHEVNLIWALFASGMRDEADMARTRYLAVHGRSADTTDVVHASYRGFADAGDWETADSLLETLRPRVSEFFYVTNRIGLLQQVGRHEEAVTLLEDQWKTHPLDSSVCNNLAWSYAILGNNLDRADELIRTASMLDPENSNRLNTKATILARRGDWAGARKIYMQALAIDDLPKTRIVNDYFIGLCDWELGQKGDALTRWRNTMAFSRTVVCEPEWVERIRASLEKADAGGSVEDLIFPKH